LHAESTGDFRLTLVSAITQSERWSQLVTVTIVKTELSLTFTFWLIFGLSQNLVLRDSLGERLSQKTK